MSVNIYKGLRGTTLAGFVAGLPEVQDALDREAKKRGRKASRILHAKAQTHNADPGQRSFVEVTRGRKDRYVWLSDERGQLAAMSIEFGRNPDPETGEGGSEGLHVLRDAMLR